MGIGENNKKSVTEKTITQINGQLMDMDLTMLKGK